jgi:RNA polymerase sigma-70 factor (ECF subfamily)
MSLVPDTSDVDLVKRAQGGQVEAVGELYDRHYTRIFRYLWSRVRDPHLAEDLTGEVFARMVRDLPGYRPRGVPFQAWLYRIAHNLAVDHQRMAGRHPQVSLDAAAGMSAEGQDPVDRVERQLTVERVEKALNALAPNLREVVVLRFLVGLSLKEAAAALDKTVAAVKSLQHRGLVALRVALDEE